MKIYDYNGKKNLSGKRIREARIKKRYTQAKLAIKMQTVGITIEQDSISRIEKGSRFIPDYEIPAFAKVLDVTPEWLLSEPEE